MDDKRKNNQAPNPEETRAMPDLPTRDPNETLEIPLERGDESDVTLDMEQAGTRDPHDTVNLPETPLHIGLWRSGEIILDDYRIERPLGQGGAGTVYLVRQLSNNALMAVKAPNTSAFASTRSKQLFFREIRTWIDLPAHPHLTRCFFFKTTQKRIVIFAEYVAGGTLKEWIRDRKLLELERIVDVAIQFAWGLQAAHDMDVIHQDIKPANVLLTKDGTVKITDFGLSRASGLTEQETQKVTDSPSVSTGIMTPAYCSPEQNMSMTLDFRTDMWSYGVSIMEMFTGPCNWMFGAAAADVLKNHLLQEHETPYPEMPYAIREILEKCFRYNPEDRWASMQEIADILVEFYFDITGDPYPQTQPEVLPPDTRIIDSVDRMTESGEIITDPADWLRKVIVEAGEDPSLADELLPVREGSRKAQLLADLEVYEEVSKRYKELVDNGREDLLLDTGTALFAKARIHETIGDLTGAVEAFDTSMRMLDEIPDDPSNIVLNFRHGNANIRKAVCLCNLGNLSEGETIFDSGITRFENLVEGQDQRGYRTLLGRYYMSKAIVLRIKGQGQDALILYNRAEKIFTDLVDDSRLNDTLIDLTTVYLNTAVAMVDIQDYSGAITYFQKNIDIIEELVYQKDQKTQRHGLATAYQNLGGLYNVIDKKGDAIACYDRTIEIWEQMVYIEKRSDYEQYLALIYNSKATSLKYIDGKKEEALNLYGKARQIAQRLTYQEGFLELEDRLHIIYMNTANLLADLGRIDEFRTQADEAEHCLTRLINDKNRRDLVPALAEIYAARALLEQGAGNHDITLELYDRSFELIEKIREEKNDPGFMTDNVQSDSMYRAFSLLKTGRESEAASLAKTSAAYLKERILQEEHSGKWKRILDWGQERMAQFLSGDA